MRNYFNQCLLEIIALKSFNPIGTFYLQKKIFSKGFKDSQRQWKDVNLTI